MDGADPGVGDINDTLDEVVAVLDQVAVTEDNTGIEALLTGSTTGIAARVHPARDRREADQVDSDEEEPDDNMIVQDPNIIVASPPMEMCTRLVVAILCYGPANDNEEVVRRAQRYLEYSLITSGAWRRHPLLKSTTIDLRTVESRARYRYLSTC